MILNCSALPSLLHLLSNSRESIRKEACWTISNITAGNRAQIQVGLHWLSCNDLSQGRKCVHLLMLKQPLKKMVKIHEPMTNITPYCTRPELKPGYIGGGQAFSPLCHSCSPALWLLHVMWKFKPEQYQLLQVPDMSLLIRETSSERHFWQWVSDICQVGKSAMPTENNL